MMIGCWGELLASASERGIALTGEGGLFPELVKAVQGTRDAGLG